MWYSQCIANMAGLQHQRQQLTSLSSHLPWSGDTRTVDQRAWTDGKNTLATQWFSTVGLQRRWRSLLISHVPLSQVVRWFERNVRVDLQTLLAVPRAYPPAVSSWLLTSWKEKRQAEGAIKANSPAANGSSHIPGHSSPQAPLRQNVKAMY